MANCAKNSPITVQSGGALVKNIKFSADCKELQVFNTGGGSIQCVNDIDSSTYLGVSIVSGALVFSDAFTGLTNNLNSPVSANPVLRIRSTDGALDIIGIDDLGMGFAVTRVNVLYDSATNAVKYQI